MNRYRPQRHGESSERRGARTCPEDRFRIAGKRWFGDPGPRFWLWCCGAPDSPGRASPSSTGNRPAPEFPRAHSVHWPRYPPGKASAQSSGDPARGPPWAKARRGRPPSKRSKTKCPRSLV